ncbi:hypothetical protein HYV88_05760 [Candidatus Woesearchaeota archaeon]|nr:hypothetical protein [Candidatus Woesearchaeota archaeon]
MPIKVEELKKGGVESKLFLRGQILDFLKNNSKYAYTLKELYTYFLERDTKSEKRYINKKKVLYHLIYGYLREFIKKNKVVKEGNFYYYNGKKE